MQVSESDKHERSSVCVTERTNWPAAGWSAAR